MTSQQEQQKLARLAGVFYLILAPLGFFGLLYTPQILAVAGDPIATLQAISDAEFSYRLSILSAFIIQVLQFFIAIALYFVFRSVSQFWAALIPLFTFITMPIALMNELSRVAILYLINDGLAVHWLETLNAAQLAEFLLSFNEDGMMIAHIFWGAWLLPMGVLILKSRWLPAWIGWLMVLAFSGYVADTLLWILIPNETFDIAMMTFWGEIIFPLWLVFKGLNVQEHSKTNAV